MARYDLSETEWRMISPLLPNKPRGVARVDDRRVVTCRSAMGPTPPSTIATTAKPRLGCGCEYSRRWRPNHRSRCS